MSDSDLNTLPKHGAEGGGRREGAAGGAGRGREVGQQKVRGPWVSEELEGEEGEREVKQAQDEEGWRRKCSFLGCSCQQFSPAHGTCESSML